MTAEAPGIVRAWTVGAYHCTLTVRRPRAGEAHSAALEWSPRAPSQLTGAERRAYRIGRDAAISDLARELGVTVAVVETP